MANIQPIENTGSFQTDQGIAFQGANLGENLSKTISSVLGFFTVIAGLAFIAYFFFGAIGWITSQGDEQKIKKARDTMTNAFIGIIIAVIAYPLIYLLGKLFGLSFTDPQTILNQLSYPNLPSSLPPLPFSSPSL